MSGQDEYLDRLHQDMVIEEAMRSAELDACCDEADYDKVACDKCKRMIPGHERMFYHVKTGQNICKNCLEELNKENG